MEKEVPYMQVNAGLRHGIVDTGNAGCIRDQAGTPQEVTRALCPVQLQTNRERDKKKELACRTKRGSRWM